MNSKIDSLDRRIFPYARAIALASALIVSNVHAGEPVRSETVRFADLNLDTRAGAEALYARIQAAAWRLCEQPAGEQAAATRCMRKAEDSAIEKLNIPLLTELYQEKTGSRPQSIIANR